MNLATPAPDVEPATADRANHEDPAVADPVQQSEPARVSAATVVDPALPYDDPMRHAPAIIRNPQISRNALSADALRGDSGSAFESYAAILRGAPEKNIVQKLLPFYFGERDFATYGEVKKYCLVKGGSAFVYSEETSPSPIYAIPLEDVYSVLEDPNKPDKFSLTINPVPGTNRPPNYLVTVLLKYRKDKKQAYQFTFDITGDPSIPQRFMEVVEAAQKVSKNTVVTKSTAAAQAVSDKARKAQPLI